MAETQTAGAAKAESAWISIVRALAVCAAFSIGLGVAFVALLALVLSVTSDDAIVANLGAAAETGVLSETSYPRSPYGHSGHRYDMYTDCVAFGANLSNEEDGLLRRIALTPSAGREGGDGPCQELHRAALAGDVTADHGYMRFWHGYQAYIRPFLSVMPLDAFLRMTAILFFAALVFFTLQLQKTFGPSVWLVALAPFFLISDFLTASMLVTHSVSLIWAFLPAALVPIILERVPNARKLVLPVFVFCAGATYNFLNFLINPPLAPALIAFLYIALNISNDERETRRTVLYAFGLVFLWFAGFASAWIEKWLFATMVLGPDAVMAELTRVFGKYDATRERLAVNFLGATRRNVEYTPFFFGYLLTSIAVATAMVAWTARKAKAWRQSIVKFIALMTPLAVIILWVEANRAHSAEHIGFVSRSFLLFSIIPLLAAIKIWRDARDSRA